jgi:hypothetical protein
VRPGTQPVCRSVQFSNRITSRAFVWLASLLVPAQSMPLTACGCGNEPQRQVGTEIRRTDAAPATSCRCCGSGSMARRSCCTGTVPHSARRGACCAERGKSSGCSGGAHSPGTSCHCSKSRPAPVPVPVPNDTSTDKGKSSSSSPFQGPMVLAVVVADASSGRDSFQPVLSGPSAPERLSLFCRLVI